MRVTAYRIGGITFASLLLAGGLVAQVGAHAAQVGVRSAPPSTNCPSPSAPPLAAGIYTVSTAGQLQYVWETDTTWDDTIVLASDISMGGSCIWSQGIGTSGNAFIGTFDGQGHSVTGMAVYAPGDNEVGFFGFASDAVIRDMRLIGVDVTGSRTVGGLVGQAESSVISGVVTSGDVEATDYRAGGLVGLLRSSEVRQSGATGDITSASATIYEGEVGGLIGLADAYGSVPVVSVEHSFAKGDVTVTTGAVRSYAVGGLIGYLSSPSQVVDSYAWGDVNGDGRAYALGGLIGQAFVNATDDSIDRTYAIGAIQLAFSDAGGLVGDNSVSAAIADSLWDVDTSGISSSQGGTGATTAAMTNFQTYDDSGWVIVNGWQSFNPPTAVWGICSQVNDGYPFLLWEYMSNPCVTAPIPSPEPVPAAAPRDVTAMAGDGSASVSWAFPASSGSYPVSHYLATSSPGGQTCLVAAPALNCDVRGLTNGTAYTFAVKALTGAGWSASSEPSNAVVPRPSAGPSIVITGSREGKRIEVTGSTTGFGMAGILDPWVRLAGQSAYSEGSAQVLVSMDGAFEWSRTTGKKASVYMQTPDGSVKSNTVAIPAR